MRVLARRNHLYSEFNFCFDFCQKNGLLRYLDSHRTMRVCEARRNHCFMSSLIFQFKLISLNSVGN